MSSFDEAYEETISEFAKGPGCPVCKAITLKDTLVTWGDESPRARGQEKACDRIISTWSHNLVCKEFKG